MGADVAVEFDGGHTTLLVGGQLDAAGARELLHVAALAAAHTADPITVDLSGISSFTTDGVLGVTGCRQLGRRLGGGLTIRVRGGAGARALLASLAASP